MHKNRDNRIGVLLDSDKNDSLFLQMELLTKGFRWKNGTDEPIELPIDSTLIITTIPDSKWLEWNDSSPYENLAESVRLMYRTSIDDLETIFSFPPMEPEPTLSTPFLPGFEV